MADITSMESCITPKDNRPKNPTEAINRRLGQFLKKGEINKDTGSSPGAFYALGTTDEQGNAVANPLQTAKERIKENLEAQAETKAKIPPKPTVSQPPVRTRPPIK